MEKFPNNFKEFKITFGWDDKLDKPNILNKDANDYIDRLFVLVSKSKYKSFKSIIINISIDGKWEADAVGYFQKKLREIIKTDESFVLMLDDLNEKKIMLHKQSKSLTDRKDPDKEIPNEVLTVKDFGNVEFQNYNLK